MNIAVIGSGYVGLVTAVVFAELGNNVIGIDIDEERIRMLNCGESPIFEPGLDKVLQRNISAGRLTFSMDTAAALRQCEIIFIAVGTPSLEDGSTDLAPFENVVRTIASSAEGHHYVVNKSTVPVGTGARILESLNDNAAAGTSFDVLSNPEFLREGTALYDAMNPDRVIIGAESENAAKPLLELYAPLNCPIFLTDLSSSEMIKYASNAFLASKISFINAMADLCEETGADVRMVAKGMGFDDRIGAKFLNAGIGFGGSCFPKDVDALVCFARQCGRPSVFLEAVREVNNRRVAHFIERISAAAGGLDGKTIAVLGLTFKPDTDDLRESKSLELCSKLLAAGATVQAHDPVAMKTSARKIPQAVFCDSAMTAAAGADIVILATEWKEYLELNIAELREVMRGDLLADGRNAFDAERVESAGLRYLNVGRTNVECRI